MAKFHVVSEYWDDDAINLPQRKTAKSAGYDFEVAEDIVIKSSTKLHNDMVDFFLEEDDKSWNDNWEKDLTEMAQFTKDLKAKPTLVPTGIKCELGDDEYLELSVRSSCPLKYWLILANGVGIIDADYYNNPDNEGHIYFQIINLSPFDIVLHKGDKIGQGIIHKYITVEDDNATGERVGGFGSTDGK